MSWFFYALATPALYSVSNFVDKFLLEKRIRNILLLAFLRGLIACLVGTIILLINGLPFIGFKQTAILILAGILLILYILPYYQALLLDDASLVVPLYQFGPIFVLILSAIFLKEYVGPQQLSGFLFIIVGGLLLGSKGNITKILKPRRSFYYMMASSFLYSSVGVLLRSVLKIQSFWVTIGYEYIGMGLGAILLLSLPTLRRNFAIQIKKTGSVLGFVTAANGIDILALMSEAYAISLVPVAFVSVVGGTQPLFLLIYGLILSVRFPRIIKEDISKDVIKIKLITIVLIFIGLYLIYF